MTPAEEHRLIAAGFTDRVQGASRIEGAWDAPAPVEGWAARDVVRHLVEWLPGFLSGVSEVRLPTGYDVDADPEGAWLAHRDAVQAVLDDPETAGQVISDPRLGTQRLDELVGRIYTSDVFMHTWDLARATGQDEALDPDRAAAMLEGMLPLDEMLRASGQYGPRVAVPDDSDPTTRLMAFVGRNPLAADGRA